MKKKQTKLVIPSPPKEFGAPSAKEESKLPAAIPGLEYYMGDTGDWLSHRELQSCGYYYNNKGRLRDVATQSEFKFTDQSNYDKLASAMIRYVQDLLRRKMNLKELFLPLDSRGDKSRKNNIFVSEDFTKNTDKCLIIIQGMDPVRAGIWARASCINTGLDVGSMIPYIRFAQENGFSLVILNPNKNKDEVKHAVIKQNGTMKEHCRYVWENVLMKQCKAKNWHMIAFSAGGTCAHDLLKTYRKDFTQRVVKFVIGDSHFGAIEFSMKSYLSTHAIHVVASKAALGTDLTKGEKGAMRILSAGTTDHSYVCGTAIDIILGFIFGK